MLRSGLYAATILAGQKENNEGVEDEHDKEPIDINSKKLILKPLDYPETVEAVFRYGSGGRFASWAPFVKYVYKLMYIDKQIIIPSDNHYAYSSNKTCIYKLL